MYCTNEPTEKFSLTTVSHVLQTRIPLTNNVQLETYLNGLDKELAKWRQLAKVTQI